MTIYSLFYGLPFIDKSETKSPDVNLQQNITIYQTSCSNGIPYCTFETKTKNIPNQNINMGQDNCPLQSFQCKGHDKVKGQEEENQNENDSFPNKEDQLGKAAEEKKT